VSDVSMGALDAALAPYRHRSNHEIEARLAQYEAARGKTDYPSAGTMRANRALFGGGKRYRYAVACLTYQGLTGSAGFERPAGPATWLELYHLYTLFLDDIMDEDERRRTVPSAWLANGRAYRGRDARHPARLFRSVRHRYGASMAILDALRIRSLAERAIQGAVQVEVASREQLLQLLTETDLRLSDGQGLDIDLESLPRVPESDYERMSELKTGVLYVAAAETGAILAGATPARARGVGEFARRFSIAFQDRDDLLGSGVVRSRIGGSREGDIAQGKRTRLFAIATAGMPASERKRFLGSYGKGTRTTAEDVRFVREAFREHALARMMERIEENVSAAVEALRRSTPAEPYGSTLQALARAQLTRES